MHGMLFFFFFNKLFILHIFKSMGEESMSLLSDKNGNHDINFREILKREMILLLQE